MRELAPNEIDLVSAGPAAVTPLALVDLCNSLATIAAPAMPGIFPAIGNVLVLNQPSAIAK